MNAFEFNMLYIKTNTVTCINKYLPSLIKNIPIVFLPEQVYGLFNILAVKEVPPV